MNFSNISINELNRASSSDFNAAKFGIVKMDHKGTVTDYNDNQATHTGMSKGAVMGKHFFTQVAPCTNNFLVGQKFEKETSLDNKLAYTFTIKMAPTPVNLRLLKDTSAQYLLCDW
jgi:photoactive yellow protein